MLLEKMRTSGQSRISQHAKLKCELLLLADVLHSIDPQSRRHWGGWKHKTIGFLASVLEHINAALATNRQCIESDQGLVETSSKQLSKALAC